jgi:S-DNA-T family DNA segregation ATPase FtsK/SpoIIIE
MAKKQKGKPKSEASPSPQRGKLAGLSLVAIALVAIIFFLGNEILDTAGFGFLLGIMWVLVVFWLVRRQGWGIFISWWNFWLGAIFFTLAIWGILSLIQPSGLTIAGADLSQVSLGGNAGKNFIGNQGVGVHPAARLTILILAGVALILPRPSLAALKILYSSTIKAVSALTVGVRWLLLRLRQWRVTLARNRYHLSILAAPIASLKRVFRCPGITEPEKEGGAIEVVALSPEVEERAGTLEKAESLEQEPRAAGARKRKAATAEPSGTATQLSLPIVHQLPPIDLLDKATETEFSEADNEKRARLIEEALKSYGVEAKVVQINPGPSVTQFGLEPGWDRKYKRVVERDSQGKVKLDRSGNPIERLEEISKTRVKVERIAALANNLALALATPNIRIETPVPGKSLVGIEVPNTITSIVRLRGVIEGTAFQRLKTRTKLAMALGKGAAGEPVSADLCKMPHLLIAGATGSGKTVFINSTITCFLMHNTPQDMRLLLIDPKRVELVCFEGVPHLISPVVTESEKAIDALRRVLREMDNRYNKFSAVGARNIEGYNKSSLVSETMPYLVVVIDELAHLMMSAAEVVEPSICRLAQMSRATGIHLIVATQRPSTDVVTGLIKANFPTRISFAVASGVDSRVILDTVGAETLLGGGDMLYLPTDAPKPKRLRGCFVSDQEIDRVVSFWKQQRVPVKEDSVAQAFASLAPEEVKDEDPLLEAGRRLAREHSHLSTSLLQRRLHIGYPRAARIMDLLEEEGTVVRREPDRGGGEFASDEGAGGENGETV